MSHPTSVISAIVTAMGIVGYANGAPGGHGAGAPMGGMGHTDMRSPQLASSRVQENSPIVLLNQNTKLASNLQKLLPAGMTPQQACTGFKNLGSCVAAVHVAHNLAIPFAELKPKVIGSGALTLGKAIHALRPDTDADKEARKAEGEARAEIRIVSEIL